MKVSQFGVGNTKTSQLLVLIESVIVSTFEEHNLGEPIKSQCGWSPLSNRIS